MSAPTKVTGRRSVAWIIDLVPGIVLFVVGVRTFGTARPTSFFDDDFGGSSTVSGGIKASLSFGDTEYVATGTDALKVFGLVLLWGLLNSVVLQGTTGASVGKHLLGLRVVRPDGSLCGPGKAAIRWLVLAVDAFPYFVPLVGFVMALSTQGNRRLGDMAAGTYVVDRRHSGPVVLGGFYDPYQQGQPGAYGAPVPQAAPATEPQWDAARNAWIRWDGTAWLQHDAARNAWGPIR